MVTVVLVQAHPAMYPPPNYVLSVIIPVHHARCLGIYALLPIAGRVSSMPLMVTVILVQAHPAITPPPNYVPRVIIPVHHARYLHIMDIIIALLPIAGTESSIMLMATVILVQTHSAIHPTPKNVPSAIIPVHHARYLHIMEIIIAA